jgi:amidohydrolase
VDSGMAEVSAVLSDLDELLGPVTEFYVDLHQHPELSGFEERTATRLATWLAGTGFQVTTGVGGHGVVGVLRNGEGPVVMLRAELDGLPVRERTGLPYASVRSATGPGGDTQPVMHACGHDIHVACVAGAASLLARHVTCWRGTVMIVGQPAEETLSGAAAMLADGLYTRWPRPDVVLAQHVAPLPAGMIAHAFGPVTAASVALELVIHGRGGHGAMPHLVVNPIPVAASTVLSLQETAAGAAEWNDRVVTTVGAIHAGTRSNVIPDRATITVGLRSLSAEALARAVAGVERITAAACAAANCPKPPEIVVLSESPVNINEPALADLVRGAQQVIFSGARVTRCPPSMATEDFPLFGSAGVRLYGGDAVPTVYWMIGSVGPRRWAAVPGATATEKLIALPPNHSGEFAPDPIPTIRTGVSAMISAALGCLGDLSAK